MEPLFLEDYHLVIAFNKPYGVLCQFTRDQPGQKTLAEYGLPKGVYPLGRLDMDSEGLLMLSNEPAMNGSLLKPSNAHPRAYQVQVEGIPNQRELDELCEGKIVIQGHHCLPCKACIIDPRPEIPPRVPPIRVRREIPDTWISITLTEGKNRQIRKMTAAIGHPTLRLIRVSIGGFSDPSITAGQWRILGPLEIGSIGF